MKMLSKRFLRFGRALTNDPFIRFGRSYPPLGAATLDKRFLRFGRAGAVGVAAAPEYSDLLRLALAHAQAEGGGMDAPGPLPLYRKRRSALRRTLHDSASASASQPAAAPTTSGHPEGVSKREAELVATPAGGSSGATLEGHQDAGTLVQVGKRFMRFGRGIGGGAGGEEEAGDGEEDGMQQGGALVLGGGEEEEGGSRIGAQRKRFMRFGKRFMRFGRRSDSEEEEEGGEANDDVDSELLDKRGFMRFGKRYLARLGGRLAGRGREEEQEEEEEEAAKHKRFMRFGKRFMRFGRASSPSLGSQVPAKRFMRFGKRFMRFGRSVGSPEE